MEVEVERVTGLIHPVHQKVHKLVTSIQRFMPKHVSSNLVGHMQKTEEEVCGETKKLVKIVEDF